MVRYGDQEQSSPGGAQYPRGYPGSRRPVPPGSLPDGKARVRRTGSRAGKPG